MSFNDSNLSVCKLPTSTVHREVNQGSDGVQVSLITMVTGVHHNEKPGYLEAREGARDNKCALSSNNSMVFFHCNSYCNLDSAVR